MLNMACTLFRLTPEEALRGVTVQRARARSACATAARWRPASAPTSSVWDVEHPTELAYWFGRNPCRRVVVGGRESARRCERRASSRCTAARAPLLVSLPHVGTADPGRRRRAAACRARSPSRTPTGTSIALYAFARELGASLLVPRYARYVDRPEPAAREHADVPRRQQHRAVPDALLHRRAAVPRRPRARRRRDRAARRAPTGSPYHDALARRARSGCAPSTATRCCSTAHSIKARAAVAVRRPAARPEPRHRRRRELRAGAARARSARVLRRASRRSRHVIDGRFKGGYITRHYGRPADGVHAVQLEMCWRCYMDEAPPLRRTTTRAPRACSRCCARWCRRRSTGRPMP